MTGDTVFTRESTTS